MHPTRYIMKIYGSISIYVKDKFYYVVPGPKTARSRDIVSSPENGEVLRHPTRKFGAEYIPSRLMTGIVIVSFC